MAEFSDAIKKGIENSKLVKKNTHEIGNILKDAEAQINSFLNRDDISLFQKIDDKNFAFSLNVARHKMPIGGIQLSNIGYPIKVISFGLSETCLTAQEFQDALCDTFSQVDFGDYLKRVQQLGRQDGS